MRGWVHEGYHVDVGTIEALARTNQDAPGVNARRLMGGDGFRPAAFLDRDGVLLEPVDYLSDINDVRLIEALPTPSSRCGTPGTRASSSPINLLSVADSSRRRRSLR